MIEYKYVTALPRGHEDLPISDDVVVFMQNERSMSVLLTVASRCSLLELSLSGL